VGALVTAAVLVVGLGGRALGGSSEPDERRTRPHLVVQPGQTLWSIAKGRIGPEADPRPYIQVIRELNRLPTSDLEVGQRLLLPAA
jgi:hypothetical protein